MKSAPAASLAAGALLASGLLIAPALTPAAGPIPAASAPCPGAEVVFARGREEPPGLGAVGDAFVNSLRARPNMPIGVYGVNYPANISVDSGASDMSAHVQSMAKNCPETREVLGGYSLGAEVVDVATWGRIPPGVDQHVAAVALVRQWYPGSRARLSGKTIDQCAKGDPICGRGGQLAVASAALIHQLWTGGSGRRLRRRQVVGRISRGCAGRG